MNFSILASKMIKKCKKNVKNSRKIWIFQFLVNFQISSGYLLFFTFFLSFFSFPFSLFIFLSFFFHFHFLFSFFLSFCFHFHFPVSFLDCLSIFSFHVLVTSFFYTFASYCFFKFFLLYVISLSVPSSWYRLMNCGKVMTR